MMGMRVNMILMKSNHAVLPAPSAGIEYKDVLTSL